MNDQVAESPSAGNPHPSRLSVKNLLLSAALLAVGVWAGWKIWNDLNTDEGTRQFRETLQLLNSDDASERWRAAGNLSLVNRKSEIEPAISALVQALSDKDGQVRSTAARTLGSLTLKLQNQDSEGLTLEPELIAKWVDQATHALAHAIADPETGVRLAAIDGLSVMSKQPNAPSRGGGMGGASPRIGGPVARKPVFQPPPELAESLGNGETKWSRASAQTFYGYLDTSPPPELITALSDESPKVRREAASALVNYPLNLDAAIPSLVSMLETDEPPVREECNAALRLAWPTAAVVPALREALKSKSPRVTALAALLLGRIGPEAGPAVPDLLVVLKQPLDPAAPRSAPGKMQEDPPCLAARALGAISTSGEVIAALSDTLKSDLDYRHGAAAYGLTQIGEPARAAAPALVAAYAKWLKSKERLNTGQAMTIALGRLAPKTPAEPQAVAQLIEAIDLKDKSIAIEAAKALAKFGKGAVAAVPRLRTLKEQGKADVTAAAAAALEAIEGTSQPNATGSKPS